MDLFARSPMRTPASSFACHALRGAKTALQGVGEDVNRGDEPLKTGSIFGAASGSDPEEARNIPPGSALFA